MLVTLLCVLLFFFLSFSVSLLLNIIDAFTLNNSSYIMLRDLTYLIERNALGWLKE